MIVIISPAKRLDFDSTMTRKQSVPLFLDDAKPFSYALAKVINQATARANVGQLKNCRFEYRPL